VFGSRNSALLAFSLVYAASLLANKEQIWAHKPIGFFLASSSAASKAAFFAFLVRLFLH
jgi:hypothetical protein